MKIKVKKDVFLKALQKVSNIVGTRTTLPVLANVLMEAEEGKLTLTTTDLELRMTTSLEAEVEESGVTTLPVRKLVDFVSKLRQGEISITSTENHHSNIQCGTIALTLLGLNPEDFPTVQMPEFKSNFKLANNELAAILDRISYAVSADDSRKVLQGILFSIREGKITAVSTDGKRLALVQRPMNDAMEGDDAEIIVTLKSANELKRLLSDDGETTIEIGDKQIQFKCGATVILSKLIEGIYPNYSQVIPPSFKKTVEIPCEDFIYAVDILNKTLLSDVTPPSMKFTFEDNKLTFEASSLIGEGKQSIDVEYADEKITASFNPNFMLDPFKHLPAEKVVMKINDEISPMAIESGDGFLYVIMPMRNK